MRKPNMSGRAMSIPSGLAVGALVSIIVTLVISLIGAKLIMNEVVQQEQIGYCSMAALVTATLLGAIIATGRIKRRKLLVCLLSGLVYLCILLSMTALFFGGQYEGFGATILTVLLASVAAVFLVNGRVERRSKFGRKKMG